MRISEIARQLKAVEKRLDRMPKLRSDNKSGVTGVFSHSAKYEAQIRVDGKAIYLGCYSTLEEAAAARRGAEKVLRR